MNSPLLAIAVAVVVFLVWRRQQAEDALGRAPAPGGADGSPQAQAAAAWSGTGPVGNSEQNMHGGGLVSAFGAAGGAAACVATGLGALAPLCAVAGGKIAPVVEAGAKGVYKYTLGRIPFGGGGTYDKVAYNAALVANNKPAVAPALYRNGRF